MADGAAMAINSAMRAAILSAFLLTALTGCTHPAFNAAAIDHPEKEGMPGVMETPLEDTNLVRTQIPPVLLSAEAAPYARPRPANCRRIAAEVEDLDEALGDDFDAPPPGPSDEQRGRAMGETAVGAMRDLATGFIPFRGWMRRLSGAQQHDNEVRVAIYAGRVRRAYLKGLGEARGCRAPAAPYR